MTIFNLIMLCLIFCLAPAGVLWVCKKVSFFEKIGPVLLLYILGVIIGNIGIKPEGMSSLQDIMSSAMIPLAIPMMLFGCTFSRREAGLQLKLVVSGFLSVALAVVLGYLLFGRHMNHGTQVGGIITGMYTGGTLNAAALQAIFKIPGETFVLINSYDILISFLYFVFLFSVGIKLFRWLYGQQRTTLTVEEQREIERQIALQQENPYRKLFTREGMRQLGRTLLATVAIVALSAGVAILCPEGWFMVVFILMITTLGVACSFAKRVREMDLSYDVGMYLIYIFSLTIASMADFSNLDLRGGINQLAFMLVAVFLSLLLHSIGCRVLRVDADSMMISSVAFINSPPFVPMMVVAMKNKSVLIVGLGAGIIGYAAGNYFGVVMAKLLELL